MMIGRRFKFKKVYTKLLFSYIIIVLLTVSLIWAVLYSYFSYTYNESIQTLNSNILQGIRNQIDSEIISKAIKSSSEIASSVYSYSQTRLLFYKNDNNNYQDALNTVNILKNNNQVSNKIINTIYIYFRENDLLLSNKGVDRFSDISYGDSTVKDLITEFVQSSQSSRWTFIRNINPFYTDTNEEYFISYLRTAPYGFKTNVVDGVVMINFSESVIKDIIRRNFPTNEGDVFIVNGEGEIILSTCSLNESNNLLPNGVINTLVKVGNGKSIKQTIDNKKMIITSCSLISDDLKIVSVVPSSFFFRELSVVQKNMIYLSFAIMLIGIILSGIFSRKTYNPFKFILHNAQRANFISDGFQPNSHDEYDFVSNVINNLLSKNQELNTLIENNLPVISNTFLINLITGRLKTRQDIEENNKIAGFEWDHKFIAVIIIDLEKDTLENLDARDNYLLRYKIIDFIDLFNSSALRVKALDFTDARLVAITCFNSEECLFEQNMLLENTLKYIQILGSEAKICVSSRIYTNLLSISTLYEEVVSCIKMTYFKPQENIFDCENIMPENISHEPEDFHFIRGMFEQSLELRDMGKIKQLLNDFKAFSLSGKTLPERCIQFLHELYSYIDSFAHENTTERQYTKFKKEVYPLLYDSVNINEASSLIMSIISSLFDAAVNNDQYKNKIKIQQIKEWIKNNLDKDLSLTSLSDIIDISPQYLCKVFKDIEGCNLLDYINKEKMDTAINLLKDEINIDSIATVLGFSSSSYFIKVFKKTFGLTPHRYRLIHFSK